MHTERNLTHALGARRVLAQAAVAALCLWIAVGAAQSPEGVPDGAPNPRDATRTPSADENVFLWEGFERPSAATVWSVDSADDPADISRSDEFHTQGAWSLRVRPRFGAKRKALVRRVASLKLVGLTRVLADVHCSEDDLGFSFAYKDNGERWYDSGRIALRKGWNRDVACDVAALKQRSGPAVRYGSPDQVEQFYLVIHAGEADAATVHLDNLRFEGTPARDWNRTPPQDLEVYQPRRGVGRYERFQVGVQFAGAHGDLFDPDNVLVEGRFTGPDDTTRVVRGFFAGYANAERFGAAWPIFLVRFAPPETGRWTFVIRVRNAEGETTGRKRWFYVTDSDSGGFVRVSRGDPNFFELDNGELFYPIGQNIAWTQDYEPYFRRQQETGQNWVRIWLCPWHLQLEKKAGRYDLADATRLDGIVEQAAAHGLRIQLVLVYHGMVTEESWAKNPYNWTNGGPCDLASEFFSSREARDLFKRRLDYIVARWGYATSIFAWELFNEVDWARYSSFNDVVRWHEEMSRYLKQIDPNRHLVTTSLSREAAGDELWRVPGIDFVQAHVYGGDVAQQVLDAYLAAKDLNKPFFVAEYGRGSSPAEAARDRSGAHLRQALWSTFMLPTAGNAMPWWWDSLIRPNNLERYFRPLSQFASDVERRGQKHTLIETAILKESGAEIAVRGLLNSHNCYLWLHRPPAGGRGNGWEEAVLIPRGHQIALSGMLGGDYSVTVMDTATGRIIQRSKATSERGRLVVALPRSEGAVSVKIQLQGDPQPRFFTSPELLRIGETAPAPRD